MIWQSESRSGESAADDFRDASEEAEEEGSGIVESVMGGKDGFGVEREESGEACLFRKSLNAGLVYPHAGHQPPTGLVHLWRPVLSDSDVGVVTSKPSNFAHGLRR